MPNPALWGAMAAVLNYAPYIGPLVGIAIVSGVALLTYPSLDAVVLPPAAYGLLNSIEGLLLTPTGLGSRLTLAPVVLFTWLLLWSWAWGIPGALLAVPMLAALKIVCDNVPSLAPIGTFMGR